MDVSLAKRERGSKGLMSELGRSRRLLRIISAHTPHKPVFRDCFGIATAPEPGDGGCDRVEVNVWAAMP